jgi:hypothetical protein
LESIAPSTSAAETASVAARGVSAAGGIYSSAENAAGGNVWTTEGSIVLKDVESMVNSGIYSGTGEVNVLSGVHGFASGLTESAPEFFASDVAAFGNLPGVTVFNYSTLTQIEIRALLESTATTIGAFCDSGACLALIP